MGVYYAIVDEQRHEALLLWKQRFNGVDTTDLFTGISADRALAALAPLFDFRPDEALLEGESEMGGRLRTWLEGRGTVHLKNDLDWWPWDDVEDHRVEPGSWLITDIQTGQAHAEP